MKKVVADKVCEDCGTVMFKKTWQGALGKVEGWSCPECFTTRWI